MSSDPPSVSGPDSIALCAANAFTDVGAGFKVCSGSAGAGTTSAQVPNSEPGDSQTYLKFYNSLVVNPGNACIEQGLPNGTDVTSVGPPPFITGTGCCSRASAWAGSRTGTPNSGAANVSRSTRLAPFTTASAVGAFDDAGLRGGVPPDLLGLTKVWGTSSSSWMHGGVHANNTGVWHRDLAGLPFQVHYQGASWTQECMLWVRMTGDAYDPTLDPWGAVYPAPVGSYVSAFHDNSASKGCGFCNAAPSSNQVVTPEAGPAADAPCATPFTEDCNQYPLRADIMAAPAGALAGTSGDASWVTTAAATASTTGRALGLSLASQAMAQLPLFLASSALMSASDFSDEPSLMRFTRSEGWRPMLCTKASPPPTIESQ